jgi:hypothetical protein
MAGNHTDYQPLIIQTWFAIKPQLTFFIDKRQQCQDPGTFDRQSEVTLLLGGQARDPARQNLATLSDKFAEQIDIFVVDRVARFDRGNATAKISHIVKLLSSLDRMGGSPVPSFESTSKLQNTIPT